MSWVLRVVYAVCCVAVSVWLLRAGLPLGAVVFVLLAVWLRQAVESGRAARLFRGVARPL